MVTRDEFKKSLEEANASGKALTITNYKKSEYRVHFPISISDEGIEFSIASRGWVKMAWTEIKTVEVV